MPGRQLQTEAFVLSRQPPADRFQQLGVFSAVHGDLLCLRRLSTKSAQSSVILDLFDEAALALETSNQGRTWFVREARLSTTICTDNRTVSWTSVTNELDQAVRYCAIDRKTVKSIIIYGFKRSFYPGSYIQKRLYVRRIIDFYEQVEKAFISIRSNSSQTVALVVGGLAERSQLEAIRRGARLIVATPGRLEDFLKRKMIRLDGVKILVLDEVDRMLDMGFQQPIARIASTLPAVRQTLCYSATLEGAVKEVARKYLNNPVRVEIGSVLKPSENVELRTFEVEPDKKQELLEHLLGAETGSFLVFVRTKHGADRVARRLVRSGHSATQIHGDRSQAQRNQALRSFSEGRHRVLVATDVAARGIDVANVAHVINFDMPKMAEDFVHRVGRTGRASAHGVASTFAGPSERGDLKKIERTLSITMKRFRVRSASDVKAA